MKPLDLARIQSADTDGVFERFEIPALILRPVRHGLTGALKLVQGSAVRMIGYSGGGPTVAASSLAEERLGPLLQDRGAIGVEQLTRIDEVMRTEGLQFGAAAIKLGVLSKMDLARWLKEQHAHVVTQCVGADSVRVTFGPLGKLTASRSGLQLLTAIENGIRAYSLELRDELQQQLEEIRFVLPAGAIELAHDLGCSESVSQLLKMQGGETRSFQEYLASSEDDDPAVPILTLILTGLAVPEGMSTHAAARDQGFASSAGSEPVVSFAASEPARRDADDLPPAPAAARPVASVGDLEALLKQRSRPTPAPKRKLDDVDNLLTSLSAPAPGLGHGGGDFGQVSPQGPDRSLDNLFDSPQPPSAPPVQHAAAQPGMGGWHQPGMYASPSTPGGMPMGGGPGMQPGGMGAPGMYGSTPVPPAPTTGVPHYQTGVPPGPVTGVPGPTTGVPGQVGVPYAVIPKELLAAVERAQQRRPRTGLFVIGVVALLLAGVGGAALAMMVFEPKLSLPGSEGAAVAAAAQAETAPEPRKQEPPAEEPPARPSAPAAAAEEPSAAEAAPEPQPAAETPETKVEKKRPAPPKTTPARRAESSGDSPARAEARTEAAKPEPPKVEPKKPEGGGGREEITSRLANARRLLQQGDHRGVIQVCTEVLGLDPRNAMAYRNLGISYSVLGAKPQACEAYRRYLRFAGNPPDRAQIESLLTACN